MDEIKIGRDLQLTIKTQKYELHIKTSSQRKMQDDAHETSKKSLEPKPTRPCQNK